MEMADYWIEEKQLIHKLFKVLVPRFNDYKTSYTMLYRAPKAYPEIVFPRSVLELRGLTYYLDDYYMLTLIDCVITIKCIIFR